MSSMQGPKNLSKTEEFQLAGLSALTDLQGPSYWVYRALCVFLVARVSDLAKSIKI